ncbi:hypothetical protein [Roseateles depolymerans]|uniref:hypothetical protein n=1 Tax=Roseateles depolymerans TaxID=76731 RepID=UPI0011C04192|nr:hypothetical protein [Roseateles depolymerans]
MSSTIAPSASGRIRRGMLLRSKGGPAIRLGTLDLHSPWVRKGPARGPYEPIPEAIKQSCAVQQKELAICFEAPILHSMLQRTMQ